MIAQSASTQNFTCLAPMHLLIPSSQHLVWLPTCHFTNTKCCITLCRSTTI